MKAMMPHISVALTASNVDGGRPQCVNGTGFHLVLEAILELSATSRVHQFQVPCSSATIDYLLGRTSPLDLIGTEHIS